MVFAAPRESFFHRLRVGAIGRDEQVKVSLGGFTHGLIFESRWEKSRTCGQGV